MCIINKGVKLSVREKIHEISRDGFGCLEIRNIRIRIRIKC
jgi:hypothetical protein